MATRAITVTQVPMGTKATKVISAVHVVLAGRSAKIPQLSVVQS
jgi:hypothetical protein